MMTFDPNNTSRDTRFDRELARLRALVDDMEAIRSGIHPERLAGAAPILDTWVLTHRPEACLAGRSTGQTLGNDFKNSKKLQTTYAPNHLASVKKVDAARMRGRKALASAEHQFKPLMFDWETGSGSEQGNDSA